MEEIKRESNVLKYNLMKFDVVCLNLVLKIRLNPENMILRT
jgi:hypothetical protein